MKGCLSLIIKTVIAVLVFFGLKYLGVIDFIQTKIDEHRNVSQEQITEKTRDVVDLSDIDDEYTIDKNLKIFKNRIILAQHNSTGQKMLMLEPKNGAMLTKDDITSDNIQDRIDKIITKYENKAIKFSNVKVVKQDNFSGIGQTIPYVKVKAQVSNLPVKDMEGIIGVAELDDGKNLIIAAFNERNKYSQIITEAFFRKVKNAK